MAVKDITLSERQQGILDSMVRDMGYHGDWCYYVPPEQDTSLYSGYIPAMVFRDVQSYFAMNGPIYGDVPFVVGQTLEEAQIKCRLMNDYIGLSKEAVWDILDSAGLSPN